MNTGFGMRHACPPSLPGRHGATVQPSLAPDRLFRRRFKIRLASYNAIALIKDKMKCYFWTEIVLQNDYINFVCFDAERSFD